MLKRATVLIVSLALAGGVGVAASPLAGADTSVAGTYNAVAARRLIDTRAGLGTAQAPVGAGATLTFQAVTPLGVTAASALALTITAVAPARGGYLVAYSGPDKPSTSNLNFQAAVTSANSAVVAVGPEGTVSIYNGSTGTLNLTVDATGYWTAGTVDDSTAGALHTVSPARLYDSRTEDNTALAGGADLSVTVADAAGVPSAGVSAVVMNATAVAPTASGYLSVTQEPESTGSRTSSINFAADASRADLVVVPLDSAGAVSVHNGSATPVGVVLDVVGYVSDGNPVEDGSAILSTTYRAYDDRVGRTAVPANGTRAYPLVPGGDAGSFIKAAVVTVTVVASTKGGYLVPLNGDGSTPTISSLNHPPGQTVAQTMIVPVSASGAIALRNASAGAANLVIDVTGFVLNGDPATVGAAATHRLTTALAQARRAAAVRLSH